MAVIQAVRWSPSGDGVRIIDQTQLPERFLERDLRSLNEICEAISHLRVRGAPAIGIAGALGLVASLLPFHGDPRDGLLRRAKEHAERIRATRPTAVNLPWAMDRMLARADESTGTSGDVLEALRVEATRMLEEDRAMCRRIGEHGLSLIRDGAAVLTHCNAGALATGGMGTALAPIYLAHERGQRVEVVVDETRPLLQGSRLTAWELSRAGIPVTVIVDGAAASLMRSGAISICIVGADRIAANGDVANKIGTYALAVAAQHHGIPFYVAAPSSTLDPSLPNGDAIPIEHRPPHEISRLRDTPLAPEGAGVDNPAFDVTPWEMITGIVTDTGVFSRPYDFRGDRRDRGAPSARGEPRVHVPSTPSIPSTPSST